MLEISGRKFGLPFRVKWFDADPVLRMWPMTIFVQSPCIDPRIGMVRTPKATFLTALAHDPDELLGRMSSSTRNLIRQATRMGLAVRSASADEFCAFHSNEARHAPGTVHPPALQRFGSNLVVTAVSDQDRTLAMHALVADRDSGRLRLLHSVRSSSTAAESAQMVGRGNRLLHYWELMFAAERGLEVYDWGGYAIGAAGADLEGINRFKESFGGRVVEESNYRPAGTEWML